MLVDDYRYHVNETVFSEYGNTLKSTMSLLKRNRAPGAVGSTTVVMMTQVYCSPSTESVLVHMSRCNQIHDLPWNCFSNKYFLRSSSCSCKTTSGSLSCTRILGNFARLCHVPGEVVSMRPQEVNMVCEGLCESMHLLFLSVHIDIIRARVLEDTIHGSV